MPPAPRRQRTSSGSVRHEHSNLRLRNPPPRGPAPSSPGARPIPTTSRCPGWCTRRCSAAATPTPGSRASTRSGRRPRRASSPSTPVPTSRGSSSRCRAPGCFPTRGSGSRPIRPSRRTWFRYTGDILAVVVAEELPQAHDAVDLIEVDYEPLPSVTNPEAAAAADAPQLHAKDINGEDIPGNQAFHWTVAGGGDLDAAFAEAEADGVVLKERILQQRLIPNAMEPRGAVAQVQPGNGRADALEHDPEPAHRPLPLLGRHRDPGGQAARHRPGGRGRLRQQDRRLPRGFRHRVLLEEARPSGQVDRDPQRKLPGHHPRPRSRAGRRAGRHEGRQDHRIALHRPRRNGSVPVDRGPRHPDHPPRPDAVRVLHDPGPQGGRLRRLHQRPSPWRRTAAPAGRKRRSCSSG